MKKINFDFIPPHLNCKNCGDCCGLVPIGEKEYEDIKKYCIDNNVIPKNVGIFDCPFRDNENKICMIYEVRPILCKLMGVTKGMTCSNGNSYEIDGYKYITKDINKDIQGIRKLVMELGFKK